MRSVDLYSFYIVYTIMTDPDRGHLFSRDPANARDVPAGPPVAPPSLESSMYTLLSKACVASVVSQKRHGYVGARAQSVRARVGSTGGLKAVHAYMERCLLLIGVSHRCMQTRLGSSYALM